MIPESIEKDKPILKMLEVQCIAGLQRGLETPINAKRAFTIDLDVEQNRQIPKTDTCLFREGVLDYFTLILGLRVTRVPYVLPFQG